MKEKNFYARENNRLLAIYCDHEVVKVYVFSCDILLIIKNVGGGTLEWQITKDANWITGVYPNTGSCEPDESMIVTVEVTAPDQKNGEWNGNLYITSNGGDITIPIALTTQMSLAYNIYARFFERLFERFPNAFPILRQARLITNKVLDQFYLNDGSDIHISS